MLLLHLNHSKTELLNQMLFLIEFCYFCELLLVIQVPYLLTSERNSYFIEMTEIFSCKLVVELDLFGGHLVFNAEF